MSNIAVRISTNYSGRNSKNDDCCIIFDPKNIQLEYSNSILILKDYCSNVATRWFLKDRGIEHVSQLTSEQVDEINTIACDMQDGILRITIDDKIIEFNRPNHTNEHGSWQSKSIDFIKSSGHVLSIQLDDNYDISIVFKNCNGAQKVYYKGYKSLLEMINHFIDLSMVVADS